MPRATLYSPVPTEWLHSPEAAAKKRPMVTFETGKVIGIVDNGKLLAFADALERRLRARGAKDVVRWSKHYQEGAPTDALIDEVHKLVDCALVGVGN